MNPYPSIRHPITNQLINLYSDDINELLDQGHNINDLLSLPTIKHFNPMTNIEDIDYNILINMSYNELKVFCQTNKYTQKLCSNKLFWFDKIKRDLLPLPTLELLNKQKNWLKVYYILHWMSNYIDYEQPLIADTSVALLNNDQDLLKSLLEAHQIEYDFEDTLVYIGYFYNGKDFFISYVASNGQLYEADHTTTKYQQLVDFLFDAMMHGLITDLAEKFWIKKKLKTNKII